MSKQYDYILFRIYRHIPSFLSDSSSPHVLRHAGVLGLSSCIKAFPYDVPDWMPQMLVEIGEHLHDPNPIQVPTLNHLYSEFTTKTVLSMRRVSSLREVSYINMSKRRISGVCWDIAFNWSAISEGIKKPELQQLFYSTLSVLNGSCL